MICMRWKRMRKRKKSSSTLQWARPDYHCPLFNFFIQQFLVFRSMESDDSLPVLTDLVFNFLTLTPSTLGQPIEPIVIFLSLPSITLPSNPASPDEQSDSVSTTQGLSTVCSTTTSTIDQSKPPTISSSVWDARYKITSSRKERNRSKQKLRSLQRPANKDYNSRDRLTIARQRKREHFARLAIAVKSPRFNPYLHYRLRPDFFSWKLLFWDSQQQEFTFQNTILPSQLHVVPLRAITANWQQ